MYLGYPACQGWVEKGFRVILTLWYMQAWYMALITQAIISHQIWKDRSSVLVQRQHSYLGACIVQISYGVGHTSPLGKPAPGIYDQDCKEEQAWRIGLLWFSLDQDEASSLCWSASPHVFSEAADECGHLHKAAAGPVPNIPCLCQLLWSCFSLVMACLSFKSKAKMAKV